MEKWLLFLITVLNIPTDNSEVLLFLISLKAGNTGLTLTAADCVFLFDPWLNNAVQEQAIDRTHRIGQTRIVFAYKMICKDTIEEKNHQTSNKRRKSCQRILYLLIMAL
jgi:SNF2 family DNA or RNA helicase